MENSREKKQQAFNLLKTVPLVILLLAFTGNLNAQNIIWASKVIKFSSEAGPKFKSAKQILGKPNATADSLGNAWFPNSQAKPETIEIGFDSLVKARQILIIESQTPGYIRNVVVKNADGIEFPVASFGAKSAVKGPRLVTINVADFMVEIASVTITVIPIRDVPVSIDAVGLTESDKAFKLTNYVNVEPVN